MKRFLNDTSGAAAIEYALVVTLASLGIIVGVTSIGQSTREPIEDVSECLEGTDCSTIGQAGGESDNAGSGRNNASSGGNRGGNR